MEIYNFCWRAIKLFLRGLALAQSRAGEINIGNKYFRLCKVISSFKKKILNLLCHVGGGNVE